MRTMRTARRIAALALVAAALPAASAAAADTTVEQRETTPVLVAPTVEVRMGLLLPAVQKFRPAV